MAVENEIKILDIDPEMTEQRILELGGMKVTPTRLMRRHVYDITPGEMTRWVRLRDDGTQVTLTTKQIVHDGIAGVIEHEIVVNDFDATDLLLASLGYQPKSNQENRRTSYLLEGAQLEIDEWPMLKPYLEIEADSPETVMKVVNLLCGAPGEYLLTSDNTIELYRRQGIDLNEISDLMFDDWTST